MRPENLRWDGWIDDQFDKIVAALDAFESDPPADEPPTIVSLALGAALFYLDLRFASFPWRERYPNLAAFAERIGARPSFEATTPG